MAEADLSSGGGLSIGSMSNIPTLTGPKNYTEWWSKMQFMIWGLGAYSLINKSLSTQKDTDLDNKAMAVVINKLGPHLMNAVLEAKNLKDMCEKLKTQYFKTGWGAESVLVTGLTSLKQDNCSGITDYISQFRSYIQHLASMGLMIDNKLLLYFLIGGLSDEYEVYQATLQNNSWSDKVTSDWHLLCNQLYNKVITKQSSGLSLFSKQNQQKKKQLKKQGGNKSHSKDKIYCSHCEYWGNHNEFKCYKKHLEQALKKWHDKQKVKKKDSSNKGSSTTGNPLALTSIGNVLALNSTNQLPSYLKSNLNKLFHIDSDFTHHICIDWSKFIEYRETSKDYTIWTEEGPVSAIDIGKIPMQWTTKDSTTTNVTLLSVLHVPLMITNLLSLYELRKKGVYF